MGLPVVALQRGHLVPVRWSVPAAGRRAAAHEGEAEQLAAAWPERPGSRAGGHRAVPSRGLHFVRRALSRELEFVGPLGVIDPMSAEVDHLFLCATCACPCTAVHACGPLAWRFTELTARLAVPHERSQQGGGSCPHRGLVTRQW